VSDPTSPVEIGHYDPGIWAYDVYVVDSLAYVAASSDGLLIIDVSDPTSSVETGHYDTGCNAEDVYVIDSLAYVADKDDGLYIVKYTGGGSGVEEDHILKEGVSLLNVNSGINIQFSLTENKKVKVEIFNILGQRVEKLMDGVSPAGIYNLQWNGNNGIYFVRIEIGDKVYREKAIILR